MGHIDDDDDDPYGGTTGGAVEYVFDNAADTDDNIIVMGGPSRAGSKSGARRDGVPKEADERWHDGRPVLAGFALDPLGVRADEWSVISCKIQSFRPMLTKKKV